MRIIFNVHPPIGNNIGNGILQSWIRAGFQEFRLVSRQYLLLIRMIALLLPLGTFRPTLLLFFHLFGLIVTYILIYICFPIAPMITNIPNKLFLLEVVTNNTVVEPHFAFGVSCL